MEGDRASGDESRRGMRRRDDGVWFDTATGEPIGPVDAWWVERLWTRWPRTPLDPLPSLAATRDGRS